MTGRDEHIPPHVPPDRVVDIDIYHMPEAERDLYKAWKRLQDEHAFDLLWTTQNGGHWIATRGREIAHVYADHEHFSSNITIVPREIGERFPLRPTTLDPPAHRPYRKVITAALTPARVREAAPILETLAREAVARVRDAGRCEFVADVAESIPVRLFLALACLPASSAADLPRYGEAPDATDVPLMQRYADFLRPHVADRRLSPGDDLLSRLSVGEVEGRALSEDEAVDIATAVLTGGFDTVVSAAGLMMAFLARNSEHRARLVADPGAIERAVGEMLRRFPLMTKARLAKRKQHLNGVVIQAGDMIVLPPLHGLDDREFAQPLDVDFDRVPKPSSVFGNGVHHCPGHLLATAELRAIVDAWLTTIPEFEIDPARPPRMQSGILGAMLELGLRW